MSEYKAVFDDRPGAPRGLVWLLAVLLLFGGGVAVDRWLLPQSTRPAAGTSPAAGPSGPGEVVFPPTTRGAGDAAAHFEALLAAAGTHPVDQAREQVAALLAADATPGLLDRLAGASSDTATGGIRQTVVARVWADRAEDPATLPNGSRVRVQTYGLALIGTGTDGVTAAPDTGLIGGWAVHELTVTLTGSGWRLADVQPPVPAPAPDVRGTVSDGGDRDLQLLVRVLGPDSWVPAVPS